MYTKFKGKDKSTGEWQYGSLFTIEDTNSGHDIHTINGHIVDSDTVEICINYQDSDGNDIYSGDIVDFGGHNVRFLIWFCKEMQCLTDVRICKGGYFNGTDYYDDCVRSDFAEFCLMLQDPYGDFQYKGIHVIGNVHDNPELLSEIEHIGYSKEDQNASFKNG